MPLISVIIPTFNRANFITKAIDSVLAQTYTNYEIIIVDDGSTDNTKDILKPYLDKIRYIYQPNSGVSAARNVGIMTAIGKWIAFLDSDDRWHVKKLEMQMHLILNNNIKVCFSDVIVEHETGLIDISFSIEGHKNRVFDDPFDLILDITTCPMLSTMIIEKLLLMSNGCFDENMKVAEDTKLIYDLALETNFGYINCPLTIFNRDQKRDGLMNEDIKTINLLKTYHLEILSTAYEKMPQHNKKNARRLKRMLSHYLSLKAVDLCIIGDYKKARLYAFRACRLGGQYKTYRRSLVTLVAPQLVGRLKRL
jgi:glycosyltransferase involved in cell wall biosynthesis